jgi:hypothetical protein
VKVILNTGETNTKEVRVSFFHIFGIGTSGSIGPEKKSLDFHLI